MAQLTCGAALSVSKVKEEAGRIHVAWLGQPASSQWGSWAARGRWERAYAVEPKEGAARARLQGEGREKGQAGQKPGKETFSFDFVFLLFQNYFQNFSKEFEFILNFSRNHSPQ